MVLPILCIAQAVISLILWMNMSSVDSMIALRLRSNASTFSHGMNAEYTNSLHHQVDFVVQTYRETVESLIQQQTSSWSRHYTSLERDERTDEERKIQIQQKQQSSPDLTLLHQKILARSKHREADNLIVDQKEAKEEMIWDRGEDIALYLDRLIRNCSIDASTTTSFDRDCWDFLRSLVTQPRCTTRLDSRFTCQGKELIYTTMSAQELIHSHLESNTLNVVILGAGPMGLHLAHGLASIALSRDGVERHIRVLVLENRIEEPGHKKPYSRNWITDLHSEYFEIVDPLLRNFLEIIHYTGKVRIPIASLETLLLLSARNHGIQFLYEDDRNYEQLLANIPNLIVFDATGHRLDPLEIGKKDAPFHPLEWSTLGEHYLAKTRHESLRETDSLVHIAEEETKGGRLLYPVTSFGRHYQAHMLKMNDFHYTQEHFASIRDQRFTSMASTVTGYCRGPNAPCPTLDPTTCRLWCSRLFVWSAADFYREDIAQELEKRNPKNLVLTALFASLSSDQADALSYLLPRGSSFLLQDLPLMHLADHIDLARNGWGDVWRLLATMPEMGRARVSVFSYRPYMYKDPLVPGGWGKNNKNHVPLLRVGDSLASGDPNLSTGLGFHIQLVQEFILRLEEVFIVETEK